MKIKLAGIFVNDQDKALKFYTEVLGFVKKLDFPLGRYKWLTLVSPEEHDGVQLLLSPDNNPAAKTYQEAIYNQNIPAFAFFVEDLQKECDRLTGLGVRFTMPPTKVPGSMIAYLDDTCGNIIQLTQLSQMV